MRMLNDLNPHIFLTDENNKLLFTIYKNFGK